MIKKKDKSYKNEMVECYVFISVITLMIIAIFLVSGKLTGMDWIGYLIQLALEVQ